MSDVRMGASLELNVTGVQQGAKQATTSLQAIQAEIVKTQESIKTSTDPGSIDRLNAKLTNLQRNLQGLNGQGWSEATKGANQLNTAVANVGTQSTQLSRIMNRNMHGVADLFIAPGRAALIFANDLPVLIDRFREAKAAQTALAAEGKAAASSTALLAEAFNPLGLVVGLGAIALIHFVPKLVEYITTAKGAEKATKDVQEALSKDSGFSKAISTVAELREEVKLAKDGFIAKEKVVEHYNTTMGKTTGIVNDLNGVEDQLIKNASSYIEITKQKAIATAAYGKYAIGVVTALGQIEEARNTANQSISAFKEIYAGDPERLEKNLKKVRSDFSSAVKDIMKDAKQNDFYKVIGDNAEKAAARMSAQKGFNFFGDSKTGKADKATKPVIDAITELNNAFADIDRQASNHLIHLSDVAKLQLGAVNKAIDKITKGGGEAGSLADLKRHLETDLSDKGVITIKSPEIKLLKPELSKDTHLLPIKDMGDKIDEELTQLVDNIAKSGITNLAEGIGQAFGGGEGMDGIFDAFKSSLGGAIEDFGKWIIEKASIIKNLKDTISKWIVANPALAIGAGVALVALGAAMKASMNNPGTNFTGSTSSGTSFSGNIGGGVSSPGYSGINASTPNSNMSALLGQNDFKLTTNVDGNDLALVLQRTQNLNNA